MTVRPLVSVVLPCFDAARFLGASLDSLVRQTYLELEIIAVDDGSRDGTLSVVSQYAADDSRIRILVNETNLGLVAALNRGVTAARGEFIARMDADDIAAPQRIEKQVDALICRPEIDVVATGIALVEEDGAHHRRRAPVRCRDAGEARFMALFATPLAHVTMMARAPVLKAYPYDVATDSLHTEDYELMSRMLAGGVAFMNLDEPLVAVRINAASVSGRHEALQKVNFVQCARRHLINTLGIDPDPGAHKVLVNRIDSAVNWHDVIAGLRLLDQLERTFVVREPYAAPGVRGIADEQRVDILIQALLKGRAGVRLTAGLLVLRYGGRLGDARARRYLAGKFSQRRLAGQSHLCRGVLARVRRMLAHGFSRSA